MEQQASGPGAARSERPSRVVRLSGVIDAGVTRTLQKLLRELGPEERVIIDCREARLWHDNALPALATAVRDAGCVVRLLGLGYHQRRLLRYLDPETWERAASAEPR